MKPSDKIFGKQEPMSREEMQQYLDGQLSSSQNKKMEEKLLDDEFASEAAEGFVANGVPFAATATLAGSWEAKSSAVKNVGYNYKFWFIGSALVTVVAVIIIAFLLMDKNEEKNSENSITKNNPTDENNPENSPQFLGYLNKNDSIEIGNNRVFPKMYSREKNKELTKMLTDAELKKEFKSIHSATLIDKSKQITYEKTVATQPKTVETTEPAEVIIDEPTKVDHKEIVDVPVKNVEKVVESNVKLLYIKNLKAVDYSEFYTSNIAKKSWLLTGISADKETATSEGMVAEQVIKYIPYKEFLEESLTKFSKNDFKGAVSNLLIILQQYPDDLNAAFYSGLCYYNLGKSRQAINAFDKAISNSINTFREEAEWYKSLSLLEDGQRAEAKELLKKIEKENAFYGKAAREKLKGMK